MAPQLHITEIGRVVIPTVDIDKAIDFYRDTLGFQVRADQSFADGQMRWVELTPPGNGSSTALALSSPPPDWDQRPIATGIIISTTDVEADHAALKEAGADVDEEIMRQPPPVPPMFQVRDPNGNGVWIVQPLED
jgi:catechol 2,3-dioxygenase-like lactoylglutathione lyase family enzyme